MSLEARKNAELSQKLQTLASEFKAWRERSEEGAPLQKHYTQIRAITSQLEACRQQIQAELTAKGDPPSLDHCGRIEKMILELHRLWDFFRAKFVLRGVEWFKDQLAAMDELAWQCYEPAQTRHLAVAAPQTVAKEPPLVFYNDRTSPVAMPRNLSYEAMALPAAELPAATVTALIKGLPIPAIGLPWYQAGRLPEALLIAHEVGHHVQDDCRLTARIEELLEQSLKAAGAPADRQAAWLEWSAELFADLYGTLALGPAFAGALIDFLALDRAVIEAEEYTSSQWGTYPTRYLRVQAVLQTLRRRGFTHEADRYAETWETAYRTHAMQEFAADIKTVVGALLEGTYPSLGDVALPGVIAFNSDAQQDAETDLNREKDGSNLRQTDARGLFATARLCFEANPAAYAPETEQRILAQILAQQKSGKRTAASDLTRQEAAAREAAFQQSGTELFQDLLRVYRPA
jgi:hypothetical protein